MASAFGGKVPTKSTLVEIDKMDGFTFVGFEKLHELENYVKRTRHRQKSRVTTIPRQRQSGHVAKKKAGKANTAASATSTSRKASKARKPSGPTPQKSKKKADSTTSSSKPGQSALVRHKKRLRKSDKRTVSDKIFGVLFVSGFTVQDLDDYDREMKNSGGTATKRKAETDVKPPPKAAKKPRKKESRKGLKRDDRARQDDGGGLRPSDSSGLGASKPHMDSASTSDLHIKTPNPSHKHVTLQKPCNSRPSKKHLLKVPANPLRDYPTANLYRGRKVPANPDLQRHYHMQIDGPNRSETVTVSSSSDSDTLDVCSIDDIPSSKEFIESSIDAPQVRADSNLSSDGHKSGKPKTKKKKCKTCCAHPCKITEAKRVSSLWGSSYPSYNVLCVSTCKVHLPGELCVYPDETKFGYNDICIQTTAPDIEMHAKFAERFPHNAIAVESRHGNKTDNGKTSGSHWRDTANKIEHHRTTEQKRREQLQTSFVELQNVVCISQTLSENQRASKQWILQEAQKVISTLKSEAMLLTALKDNLGARNQKLKKRYTELSGKKFNPELAKAPCNEPSQSKLMSLYQQYRKDVQKDRPESTSKRKRVSSKQSVTKPGEPIVISESEEDKPIGSVENRLKEWKKVSQETLSASLNNQAAKEKGQTSVAEPPVNKFTEAAAKKKDQDVNRAVTHQQKSSVGQMVSSTLSKPGVPLSNRPAQNHSVTKPRQVVAPMQVHGPYHLIIPNQPKKLHQTSPANQPSQPGKIPGSLPFVMRLSNNNTKSPNSTPAHNVVNKMLTLNNIRQVPRNVSLIKSGNVFLLNDPSQVVVEKPTQWTSVGKIVPSVFNNVTPVEDLGAVVEVGEPNEGKEKIVLLDVAETAKKSPELATRTVSLIPSSSSINVTLKSVGSITANKIFNSKPPTSTTESNFPSILYQTSKASSTTSSSKGTTSTTVEIQTVEQENPVCANANVSGPELPRISDALLSNIENTNEEGLCVISSVFSLNDNKSGQSSSESHRENAIVTNTVVKQSSSEYENHDSPLVHDHNYYKVNLQCNESLDSEKVLSE